jgi:hypothetical protein
MAKEMVMSDGLPCRSCKHVTEGKISLSTTTDFSSGFSCGKNLNLSGVPILLYGVSDQKAGEKICNVYWHVGFEW